MCVGWSWEKRLKNPQLSPIHLGYPQISASYPQRQVNLPASVDTPTRESRWVVRVHTGGLAMFGESGSGKTAGGGAAAALTPY